MFVEILFLCKFSNFIFLTLYISFKIVSSLLTLCGQFAYNENNA